MNRGISQRPDADLRPLLEQQSRLKKQLFAEDRTRILAVAHGLKIADAMGLNLMLIDGQVIANRESVRGEDRRVEADEVVEGVAISLRPHEERAD